MLRKISPGRVESDEEGYSLHFIGPENVKYEESDKFIILDWTFDPKPHRTRIYISDVDTWDSSEHKPLLFWEKEKIKRNIVSATKLLEGTFEVM